MPTYGDLGRNYRTVMKAIRPGFYVYVTARHEGRTYSVFQLSIWDDTIDSELTGVLKLPSRVVKDNTVFFLNISRDLMLPLKIRATGGTYYLIEPRPAAQRLVAARLGLSTDEYESLVLEGGLRDLVLHDIDKLRRRYRRQIKSLKTEKSDVASQAMLLSREKERLERETAGLMGKLGVTHDDLFVSRNSLTEREAEVRLLRDFIADHGLIAPDIRPRPPWNPR